MADILTRMDLLKALEKDFDLDMVELQDLPSLPFTPYNVKAMEGYAAESGQRE